MGMDNDGSERRAPRASVNGFCGIPARLSGFFSLAIQVLVVIVASILTILIFVHIGGYSYFKRSTPSNETTSETFPTPASFDPYSSSTMMSTPEDDEIAELLTNDTLDATTETSEKLKGPFDQIDEVTIHMGHIEVEYLPALRISCLVFLGLCVAWLLSLACLTMSLRYEVLDLVYVNSVFLVIVTIYTLFMSFCVGVLLFYMTEYHWSKLLLISGVTGGLLLCFIFLCIAVALIVVWFRYIDYMNGTDGGCLCTSSIYNLVKSGGKRRQPAQDYAIPEATHHPNLPYIDDPPVQQFSNF